MNPWDELYVAGNLLLEKAEAARRELATNPYWGGDPTNFAAGINNACGGPAGELAALFNPDVAERLARRFAAVANAWPRHEPHTTTQLAVRSRQEILAIARSINGTTEAGEATP